MKITLKNPLPQRRGPGLPVGQTPVSPTRQKHRIGPVAPERGGSLCPTASLPCSFTSSFPPRTVPVTCHLSLPPDCSRTWLVLSKREKVFRRSLMVRRIHVHLLVYVSATESMADLLEQGFSPARGGREWARVEIRSFHIITPPAPVPDPPSGRRHAPTRSTGESDSAASCCPVPPPMRDAPPGYAPLPDWWRV